MPFATLFLATLAQPAEVTPEDRARALVSDLIIAQHEALTGSEITPIRLDVVVQNPADSAVITSMTMVSEHMECGETNCWLPWRALLSRTPLPDSAEEIEFAPTSPLRPAAATALVAANMHAAPEASETEWVSGLATEQLQTDFETCPAATERLGQIDNYSWIGEPGRRSLTADFPRPVETQMFVAEGIPSEDTELRASSVENRTFTGEQSHLMESAIYGVNALTTFVHLKLPWTTSVINGPARTDLVSGWAVELLYDLEPCWVEVD